MSIDCIQWQAVLYPSLESPPCHLTILFRQQKNHWNSRSRLLNPLQNHQFLICSIQPQQHHIHNAISEFLNCLIQIITG